MSAIPIDEQETIDLLKALIAINSVNPSLMPDGPGEAEIAAFIRGYMEDAGLDVRLTEIEPGRMNVIGMIRSPQKEPGRTLILNGHTDTVGIGVMEIEPLDPVEKDGRIYGRGSGDMKAGLAAMLSAAAAVARSGILLRGDVIVATVADEEYASIGTEALVQEYTADAAIVTEPTGLDILIAHKGFAWIDIETAGHAAHGSDAAAGVDAIMMMGDVLRALRDLDQTTLASRAHPVLGAPSLHASVVTGGKELSTYPDYCKLQVERRIIPGETRDMVEQEIEGLLERCRAADPKFRGASNLFFYREPLEINRDAPVVQILKRVATQTLGREPAYTGSAGWLDSGILSGAGIPTVVFGPDCEGAHAAVESTERAQVPLCAQVLAETMIAFCGSMDG